MKSRTETPGWLRAVPLTAFAIVMGLTGFAIAWMRASTVLSLPAVVGEILRALAMAVFAALIVVYLLKVVRHADAVAAEIDDPLKRNFLSAITIGVMLTSIALLGDAPVISWYTWLAGALGQLLLTLWVLSTWIENDRYEIAHINPTWFIPVVGNIMVPVAGVHHASVEISWFFFSFALLFWLILATIIFYRMIFHAPLPERLIPTLFILVVPPSLGFVSYVELTGEIDAFARVLYYMGLFLVLMLVTRVRRFGALPFTLSWWAYSFPMASITIATLVFYEHMALSFHASLSLVLLAILSGVLILLAVRTVSLLLRGEFRDDD